MQSYFSHDSNARNSEKIIKVRMRFGMEGYGTYFAILEKLREEEDYTLLKDYNSIAFELRVQSSLVKSVVEEFGLFAFTEDGERFYSESFNKRMEQKDAVSRARAEAGRKGGLARAANAEKAKSTESVANATPDSSKCLANATSDSSKKSKEKESKENPSNEGEKKAGLSSSSKPPIDERIKAFRELVQPFAEKYGQRVIDDFCDYWTEHGPKDRLFRREKETPFDIGRRLGTWVRNNSRWQRQPIVDLSKYPINWLKVMNWYNQLGLVPIQSLSELTDEKKMAYVSVYDLYENKEDFKNALVDLKKMISISYHLKGGNKDNWRADFLWLFNKENFINVKNGKYKDKK